MAIWQFNPASRSLSRNLIGVNSCPFCKIVLRELSYLGHVATSKNGVASDFRGTICDNCGWWIIKLYRHADAKTFNMNGGHLEPDEIVPSFTHQWCWSHATLRELSLTDIKEPIDDIHRYLVAKYEHVHDVSPRLMEEVVGSVFRNLHWDVVVTAFSKDGGIDAIMRKNDEECGVQIKRYMNKITVSQIREFSGSLTARKLTSGIFVTTSSFTRPALDFPGDVSHHQRIELYDSDRLYAALQISRVPEANSIDEIFERSGLQSLIHPTVDSGALISAYFMLENPVSVIHLGLSHYAP